MVRDYFVRDGRRFVRVSPGVVYETFLQALVERNLSGLFPEYMGCRLEPYLRTPAGDVKPDLVLVRRDLAGWALVEVEIDTHSMHGHVLPQVAKLTFASADDDLVDTFASRVAEATTDGVRAAMEQRPRVYLVTHGSSVRVAAELEELQVEPLDLDVHQAIDYPNDYLLLVRDSTISRRRLAVPAQRSSSPLTRYVWTIEDPDLNGLINAGRVEVDAMGIRALWGATASPTGLMIREPTGLSVLDNIVSANVEIDDENAVVHLVTVEGKPKV